MRYFQAAKWPANEKRQLQYLVGTTPKVLHKIGRAENKLAGAFLRPGVRNSHITHHQTPGRQARPGGYIELCLSLRHDLLGLVERKRIPRSAWQPRYPHPLYDLVANDGRCRPGRGAGQPAGCLYHTYHYLLCIPELMICQ